MQSWPGDKDMGIINMDGLKAKSLDEVTKGGSKDRDKDEGLSLEHPQR